MKTDQKFEIIYADPAWKYNDKASAGKRGASHKYTVTGTKETCALPVGELAAPNCALFMWATLPMLPDALEVMAAWGFKYKTFAFVWVKRNKLKNTLFFGMGNWTRCNAEICLLGIRGKPIRISRKVEQVIVAPLRKHSQKPPEIRNRIVQLLGPLPRVELFAREKVEGWSAWGNQVESDVELC